MSQSNEWLKVEYPLIDFLKTYETTLNGDNITHQILPNHIGVPIPSNLALKFNIPRDKYPEFMSLFYSHIFQSKSPHLSLMEKIGNISSMYIDIDIEYPNENIKTKQYNSSTIESFCKLIYHQIKNYVVFDDDSHYGKCVIMVKDSITHKKDKKRTKDGIHIVFPNIVIHNKLQAIIIKDIISQESVVGITASKDILESINTKPIIPDSMVDSKNQLGSMIDESIYKSGKMLMLGCVKSDRKPYNIISIMNIEGDCYQNMEIEYCDMSMFDKEMQLNLTSIYNKPDKVCEYLDTTEELLSDNGIKPKPNVSTTIVELPAQTDSYQLIMKEHADNILKQVDYIESNKDTCSKLVSMLSIEKAHDYLEWSKIGLCLYNINPDFIEV